MKSIKISETSHQQKAEGNSKVQEAFQKGINECNLYEKCQFYSGQLQSKHERFNWNS